MTTALLSTLGKITGVSFASFVYTTKGTGEKSRYVMILGASTRNLYLKDLDALAALLPTLSVGTLEYEACSKIIASRKESLEKGIGNNSRYAHKDTYTHLNNLPGVVIHNETGELYISGLVERKDVLEAGEPRKKVNSRPLTIAKRKIERTLPSGRFRQFSLSEISVAKAAGDVLQLA